MQNYIAVYDFETDSPDPKTTEPVQLAACIINPITLEIVENSEFCSDMKPADIENADYYDEHRQTIEWHAKNYKISPQEVFERWKLAPEQSIVWRQFTDYLEKYNKNQSRKSRFTAPIRAGINILRFDDLIIDRLCKKYKNSTKEGEQSIFHPRDVIELLQVFLLWFHNDQEVTSYNMDYMRQYFGMVKDGSHDALKDVKDEAALVIRFLRLHRTLSSKIKFKGSMVS